MSIGVIVTTCIIIYGILSMLTVGYYSKDEEE